MIAPEIIDDICARVSLVDVIGATVDLRPNGRGEMIGLCPFHHEKTPSFTVTEEKGFFHCFGCGAHGNVIGFVMRANGVSFPIAVERLRSDAGLNAAPSPERVAELQSQQEERKRNAEAERAEGEAEALALCKQHGVADGTLAKAYFHTRGITTKLPPSLRFASALPYYVPDPDNPKRSKLLGTFPAIIGAVQATDGRIAGVHRTYLRADGRAKANVPSPKKMAGTCWGGAVRLAKAAPELAIGEGIETCLSVAQAMPGLAVWAALSLGNMAGSGQGEGRPHPRLPDKKLQSPIPDMQRPGIVLPDDVRSVILLADSDNGDPENAEALIERAGRRFAAQGRTVRIARAPAEMDFNDLLMAADAVRSAAQ